MKGKGDHRGEMPGIFLLSSLVEMPLLQCTCPYSRRTTHLPQGLVCHIITTLHTLLYWILGKLGILIFMGRERSLTWHYSKTGSELLQALNQREGSLRLLVCYVLLLQQKRSLWKHWVSKKKLLNWKYNHYAFICYEFPGSFICWHSNNRVCHRTNILKICRT